MIFSDEEDAKDIEEEVRSMKIKQPAVVPIRANEERNRMRILEAEDKALDREIAG